MLHVACYQLRPGDGECLKSWRKNRRCENLDCEAVRFFERASELQNSRFAEVRTEDLHPHRETGVGLSAGNRNTRHSGERPCNGIYISKIHLKWVCGLFA